MTPQDDYLKLISLGSKTAAADKFKRFVTGKGLWRLKDTIDRRFMDKFDDLPEMPVPPAPANSVAGMQAAIDEEPPLCGGCGAKVVADILSALCRGCLRRSGLTLFDYQATTLRCLTLEAAAR